MKTIHLFHTAMKTTILLLLISASVYAQDTLRVVKVTNTTVQNLIEQFTEQYTDPDVIKFVQDGNGDWITSRENFQNIRYIGIRSDLKQFLRDNGISLTQVQDINSLKDALQKWGQIIDYVPRVDSLETKQ